MSIFPSLPVRRRFLPFAASLLALPLLSSCGMVVMEPSGDVAVQQADLVWIATILMLLIIVPVVAMIGLFAWRYRASNAEATYKPDWDHSTQLELVIWAAPLLIIICLGAVTWVATHLLDPYRPIARTAPDKPVAENAKPLEIQVVALDWKWLFIYPEQGIATINELAAPIDRPIQFRITASSVMNSFYVPALAGQIYAMPGMETKLHAVINKPGNYAGFSANYSGAGFSGMRFRFHGLSNADFANWVAKAKQGTGTLDRAGYIALEKPSEKEPVRHFASVETGLYTAALNMCVKPGQPCMADIMKRDAQRSGSPHSGHGVPSPHDVAPTDNDGQHDAHGNGSDHANGGHGGMAMPMPAPSAVHVANGPGLVGAGLTPPPSPFKKPQAVALEAPAPNSAPVRGSAHDHAL